MRNLVTNLRSTDKFNVMVFAGNFGWYAKESVAANSDNIEKAIKFVENQNGSGGTNLLSALKEAYAIPRTDASLSRSFVILTDGYVDVEKEAFDIIRSNNDKANTFAFGIGTSVNRFLVEGIAHVGMGEPIVVLNESEANVESEKFRNYINSPVMSNIKTSFSGFEAYDIEPATIPDMFAERPIIVFGKYKGTPKGSITLSGTAGNKKYSKTFKVSDFKTSKENAALRYLWARKRIQILDDYNNIASDNNRIQEVTDLGLKYNLLTAYTSFIAIEEDVKANEGDLKTVKQPLPMPEGVDNSAIGFDLEIGDSEGATEVYNEIEFLSEMDSKLKAEIELGIEKLIFNQLNEKLLNDNGKVTSILVQIDDTGKVVNVEIKDKQADKQTIQKIKDTIKAWNFSSFRLKKEWKFKIVL